MIALHDAVPGDWDTLEHFDEGDDSLIRQRFGKAAPQGDLQITDVLLKNGRAVAFEQSAFGVESSLADSVVFHCQKINGVVTCYANQRMRVARGYTQGDPAEGITVSGPTYSLTPE